MDASTPYRKTVKGTEAITSRIHGLSPRLRSILILVDGKRTGAELGKLGSATGDASPQIEQLLAEGFIEGMTVSATSPQGAPVMAGPISAPAPISPTSLRDAQRFAVRRLTDLLGPTAEGQCIRIESSKSTAEFAVAVLRARDMVQQSRGGDAAAAFLAEVQAHWPG